MSKMRIQDPNQDIASARPISIFLFNPIQNFYKSNIPLHSLQSYVLQREALPPKGPNPKVVHTFLAKSTSDTS
ncbi:predicted protein [Sclerotinia sclerotiorum 1980 UF-70]|uniref:Uncharacterized protein n=1 Tax=Sclerotinia sclerotiorum (strain ATCC 18683 / 1980 / Ss-1) TaxID=665079 RepID=A7EJW9_SCLS1|nr:predicted protein [Sclerotinia sclerotiorum 1980 UF-70]EDO03135.1 predicted protein [Sclerotinia sclerotiorum 1980 UF-70]